MQIYILDELDVNSVPWNKASVFIDIFLSKKALKTLHPTWMPEQLL